MHCDDYCYYRLPLWNTFTIIHTRNKHSRTVNVFYLILIRYDKNLQCSVNRMLVLVCVFFFCLHREEKWGSGAAIQCETASVEQNSNVDSIDGCWNVYFQYENKFNNKTKCAQMKAIKVAENRPSCARFWFVAETNYCDFSFDLCVCVCVCAPNDGCK